MSPVTGNILIAEPFLGDPNFERSVVLLCEHSQEGTMGFILNQPSNLNLKDLMEGVFAEMPVYVGGPVENNTLHYIHRIKNVPNAIELANGIYWSGDFNHIIQQLNSKELTEDDIRFFIGYSGWGQGQLEKELSQNSWIVADIDAASIFEPSTSQYWRKVMRSLGGEYKIMSNYPTDPRLN